MIAAYEDVLATSNGRLVLVDGTGDADDIAARVREELGL